MREKLLDLMKSEGLKPSQLAELLEINPAGVSHILAGRNKPGFDLLQKILRRFPRINPDWLLLDSGEMYRQDDEIPHVTGHKQEQFPIEQELSATNAELFTTPSTEKPNAQPVSPQKNSAPTPAPTNLVSSHRNSPTARIVIFYEDGTFESFTPTT